MKIKKRVVLMAILTIVLCFSITVGATFSLFTSESEVNVAVTYGKVDVSARMENLKAYSGKWNDEKKVYESVELNGLTFETLGSVNAIDNNIVINNMAPMDKITFDIVIENNSTITSLYQTMFTSNAETEDGGLLNDLVITVTEDNNELVDVKKIGNNVISDWKFLPLVQNNDKVIKTVNVSIELPFDATENEGVSGNIYFKVNAVQGNAHVENPKEDTDDVKYIYSKIDLEKFRDDVNSGNTYKKKTVVLMNDIDLQNEEWTPIGNSGNKFMGTFDGNGYTVENLYVDLPNSSNVGLFGFTTEGEIKNLTVKNAKVTGYLAVGAVAGCPYTSKYTNIKLTGDVEVNGFAYVGGVVGRNAYANLTNITVEVSEESYVKANSFDGTTAYRTYVGGVVGFIGEGNHVIENVTSNIDVIGSTIDVGGIAGIAHYGNTFINCKSSGNVTLENGEEESDALEIGGIAGVWHNSNNTKVTLVDCEFTGTLSSKYSGIEVTVFENNGLVGNKYSENGTGELIITNS